VLSTFDKIGLGQLVGYTWHVMHIGCFGTRKLDSLGYHLALIA